VPEPTQISFFTWVVGGITTFVASIFAFLFKRQMNRIDDHETRIAEVEADTEAIERIEKNLATIHKRVDDIWKHLADKK